MAATALTFDKRRSANSKSFWITAFNVLRALPCSVYCGTGKPSTLADAILEERSFREVAAPSRSLYMLALFSALLIVSH
jgi:hypothetical protein